MAEFWATYLWPMAWIVVKIMMIVVPLLIGVAYLTYVERKVIAAIHLRRGPNVV
ncbi:MAG: NADH-quinone oxidoreductase subunit H, partial [Rhodospirillaceae bacterium]|nr:NADH-quinone oxidoreductase subunit H [Rhodospirillaceae bacterium]